MTDSLSAFHSFGARDLDELQARAGFLNWQIEYLQLEPGAFRADILSYRCQNFQIISARYSRGLSSVGLSPAGMLGFALPLSAPNRWSWQGYDLNAAHVVLQTDRQALENCRWGEFPLGVVLFSREALLADAEKIGDDCALERLGETNIVLRPSLSQLQGMKRALSSTFQTLTGDGLGSLSRHRQIRLRQALTLQLLSWLSAPSVTLQRRCRYALVKQAETLIRETGQQPITVFDLGARLHVSERTLRYGFCEVLGVGPKAYLQTYRLHQVRQQLRGSLPHETTVTAVAQGWGFWHLGQFSRGYKKLFGELPSVTLRYPYG